VCGRSWADGELPWQQEPGSEATEEAVLHPKRVLTVAAVLLVLLGGLAVASLWGRHGERPAAAPAGTPAAPAPASPAPSTPNWAGPRPPEVDPAVMIGRADAPVTVVEFADYQCPYCGEFARTVQPALVAKYVDTGVLRLVWRDFPYYGAQSVDAAVAARAAGQQGKFWPFHDALYAHQLPLRSGRLTAGYLDGLAAALGLDVVRFDQARRDPALHDSVAADFAFGQQLGVPGTPSFLVNGSPEIFGSQPLSTFEHAIEQARGQAPGGAPPR
jgi:protein-disulfide isomerase